MDFEKLDAVAASLMKERKAHLDREAGSIYYHGQRVAKLALTLREMVCPQDSSWDDRLRLAAMFHDIGKGIEPHQRFGPPLFLEAVKGLVDEEDAQAAARLIAAHCDRRPDEPVHDVWARLIQDADLLDHLGTYNIWMDINYYSHRWQGVDELREHMLAGYERYCENNRKKINFEVSRRIFDDKLEFVFAFIQRLDKESRGEFYRIP